MEIALPLTFLCLFVGGWVALLFWSLVGRNLKTPLAEKLLVTEYDWEDRGQMESFVAVKGPLEGQRIVKICPLCKDCLHIGIKDGARFRFCPKCKSQYDHVLPEKIRDGELVIRFEKESRQ